MKLTGTHDPALRHLHGARCTYMFRNDFSETVFSCTFDSLKYKDPVEQIMAENNAYFTNRPRVKVVKGRIIPIRRTRKHIALNIVCPN